MSASELSVRQSALVGGVINALINGGLGLWLVPDAGMPLWGLMGVASDLLAMAFGVAFGTALVVTPQMRRLGRRRTATLPPLSPFWRDGFQKWPDGVIHRAINLGAVSVLLFVPLPLIALWLLAPGGLAPDGFVLFKGSLGALEGAIVTPIIALAGLSDGLRADPEGAPSPKG